jgi:hypothetical protein
MRPRAVACSGRIDSAEPCCIEVMLAAKGSSRLPDYAIRADWLARKVCSGGPRGSRWSAMVRPRV